MQSPSTRRGVGHYLDSPFAGMLCHSQAGVVCRKRCEQTADIPAHVGQLANVIFIGSRGGPQEVIRFEFG
jgi:hypothetical protein